jgi:hypothetical protein
MQTITLHPRTKKEANLLEQLAKALEVPFEKTEETNGVYNPEFVKKIKQGQKDIRAGKGIKVTIDDLWK